MCVIKSNSEKKAPQTRQKIIRQLWKLDNTTIGILERSIVSTLLIVLFIVTSIISMPSIVYNLWTAMLTLVSTLSIFTISIAIVRISIVDYLAATLVCVVIEYKRNSDQSTSQISLVYVILHAPQYLITHHVHQCIKSWLIITIIWRIYLTTDVNCLSER